ncbi:hypothetical protein CVT26_004546 [Gymnopilus dilepis]|uniref:Uncharacterized protein n=1 Tax=Gymnopilus dilepis TaxID=231916 RepID=A0A409YJ08_9AGAR|nr:hypothetical protein CVT26_004546 [Gymnopilus dilepis]
MRWSLILYVFACGQYLLSLSSCALALPVVSLVDLQERARTSFLKTHRTRTNLLKIPSKLYRVSAEEHKYVYRFPSTGHVIRDQVEKKRRQSDGKRLLKKSDADHIFDLSLHKARPNPSTLHFFRNLPPALHKEIRTIMNRPHNVALIPAHINRGKGQVVKHALNGKHITPKKARDDYTRISYSSAKRTARLLDEAFRKHKHPTELRKNLAFAMRDAKIFLHEEKSPATSASTSPANSTPEKPPQKTPPNSPSASERGSPQHRGS